MRIFMYINLKKKNGENISVVAVEDIANNYIRFSNGLQIVYSNGMITESGDTITFPVDFTTNPVIVFNRDGGCDGLSNIHGAFVNGHEHKIFIDDPSSAIFPIYFNYIAIGWWK